MDRLDTRSRVYDEKYSYYATGKGVHVYILDTGVVDQSEFENRWVDCEDFSGEGCAGTDEVAHGTHVAGK